MNPSVVVCVHLASEVVDNSIAFDVDAGCALLHHDRWSVEVDTVVHNEERVAVVDDVVVDADTIQVLLEQVLEEQVLFLKRSLLLLDGKLVEVDLVEALVEVVKLLELIVGMGLNALNLLDLLIRLFCGVRVTLVERQYLFFLSLKLAAQFCSLKDFFTQLLVAAQLLHAVETVG